MNERRHLVLTGLLVLGMALFCLRVLGQIVVALYAPSWLPPMGHWHSGLLPYPLLLVAQLAILMAMPLMIRHFVVEERRVRKGLRRFSIGYFGAMVVRYGVTMAVHPEARWLVGSIPIGMHLVLAAFLFIWAGGAFADEVKYNRWDLYLNPLALLDYGRGSMYAGIDYRLTPTLSVGPYFGEGSALAEGVRFHGGGARVDFAVGTDSQFATAAWRPYVSPFYSRYEFEGHNSPNYKVTFPEDRRQVRFTNVGLTAGYFYDEISSEGSWSFIHGMMTRVGIGVMSVRQNGELVTVSGEDESPVYTPGRRIHFTFDLNFGPTF